MKANSIYFIRFCSNSWRFGRWVELVLLSILLSCAGWLFDKISIFAGPRFPQFTAVWAWFWQAGQNLVGLSKELVIIITVVYLAIIVIAKIFGVHLIRSSRLSKNLRQMINTAVDEIPSSDENRRNKAKNIVSEQANKAVKGSFVLARKNDVLAVVKIPQRIEARKVINDYLGDVADDLSGTLNMTSSSWQVVKNSLTFSNYKVMQFKN